MADTMRSGEVQLDDGNRILNMQRVQTICLVVLATIAVGFSLSFLKPVLLPFVIALFIVIGCRPILSFIEKKLKLKRVFAFVVAFSVGTAFLTGFVMTVWLSINDLARHSDAYEERLNTIAQWATGLMHDAGVSEDPSIQPEPQLNPPENDSPDSDDSGGKREGRDKDGGEESDDVSTEQSDQDIVNSARDDARQAIAEFTAFGLAFIRSQILYVAASLSHLLSYSVLILIFVFFFDVEHSFAASSTPANRARDRIAGSKLPGHENCDIGGNRIGDQFGVVVFWCPAGDSVRVSRVSAQLHSQPRTDDRHAVARSVPGFECGNVTDVGHCLFGAGCCN